LVSTHWLLHTFWPPAHFEQTPPLQIAFDTHCEGESQLAKQLESLQMKFPHDCEPAAMQRPPLQVPAGVYVVPEQFALPQEPLG
jgi:hypothetical protein